jgi:AraC family transcriptional regulator
LTLAFHPPHEIHSESFHNSRALSFNIEVGPEWHERLGPFSKVLETPAEFQGGRVTALALRLYNEFRAGDELSALAIEGLALEMIAESGRAASESRPRRVPSWLRQAREMLHEHFTEPLSVGQIAREVGVHPVYLSSVFREAHRCTISEYVRRLRIEHACQEIVKPQTRLADIAITSGFSHQSHFNRAFKQITGLTPGQYRAAALKP